MCGFFTRGRGGRRIWALWLLGSCRWAHMCNPFRNMGRFAWTAGALGTVVWTFSRVVFRFCFLVAILTFVRIVLRAALTTRVSFFFSKCCWDIRYVLFFFMFLNCCVLGIIFFFSNVVGCSKERIVSYVLKTSSKNTLAGYLKSLHQAEHVIVTSFDCKVSGHFIDVSNEIHFVLKPTWEWTPKVNMSDNRGGPLFATSNLVADLDFPQLT